MMKRLSRHTFAALWLLLALNIMSCMTRDSAGTASHLRATKPVVASYGDDFRVLYHWGDATFLNRLANTHIPDHIYPGEEKAYGYYSDELYAEIMQFSAATKNFRGPGLYVAGDPISSIQYGTYTDTPKLIEVIIDKRVAAANSLSQIYEQTASEWFVITNNKGVYFREFSGAGFSAAELLDFKDTVEKRYSYTGRYIPKVRSYFADKVDAIITNPPTEKVRLLPPREWVCLQG